MTANALLGTDPNNDLPGRRSADFRRYWGLSLIMLLLLAVPAFAEDDPVIPPDHLVYCTVCHGIQLRGNRAVEAPRLSGMESWYVERQLEAFKAGWRGAHPDDNPGLEMRPMAVALSEDGVEDAVAYVSGVDSEPPPVTVAGDAERGRALYSSCAACHGDDAEGNEPLGGPALTVTNDWYLVRQLENYRNGARGRHPDDAFGAQMRAAAMLLPDSQAIRDVVSYLNTLQNRQENQQ